MMANLDGLLYEWICRANKRLDDLDFPVGLVEDNVALLKRVLGSEYLEHLLISDAEPVHFLDDEANPLRKWLLSALVESHIVQALELAAYFREFREDSSLPHKVEKLKRDAFWPMFFELAMATRLKRATRPPQNVRLNPEVSTSVGDFTLTACGYEVPCECSRLGHSPIITERQALEESLSYRISDGTKRIPIPLCVKIRSSDPLTGDCYNRVLRLVRKGLADARASKLPTEHTDGPTTIEFEELTKASEQIPFKMIDGRVTNILGTDWDSATSLSSVPARHSREIAERFEKGERFHQYEAVRLFTKFGQPTNSPDYYKRLTTKLKKKLKQTKIAVGHVGKVVFIEVPFDLRTAHADRLRAAVHDAAVHSSATIAVVLANREPNPHFRHHYSELVTANQAAAKVLPDLIEVFNRAAQRETSVDPILGSPYHRSWAEAQEHARKIGKANPD